MKAGGLVRLAAVALVAGALIPAAGCAYMRNRANDWNDICEFGTTSSSKTQFGMYATATHWWTLGYTTMNCKLSGFANDHWGTHRLIEDSWGWGFLGESTHVVASGDAVIPEENLPVYDTGILGLGYGRTAGGPGMGNDLVFVIHYGWGGWMCNTKGAELLDWCLGWWGLDTMDDDTDEPRPVNALRG